MANTRKSKNQANAGVVLPASQSVKRSQSKTSIEKETDIPHQPRTSEKQTKSKGRGSKQVVATEAGPAVDNIGPNPAAPPEPRKRGRKRTPDEAVDDAAPPAKKVKEGTSELPPQPAGKIAACKKADVVPRAALPDRQGRNAHPAGQPSKRRSSQEVAADREAKKKAIEDKIREGEMAKQLLAELNIAEDLDMDDGNPQRLSAATQKFMDDKPEHASDDDDGEAFDFMEVDAMPNSEPDFEDEPVLKEKRSKPARFVKGALRQDVQAIADGMLAEEEGSRKKIKSTNVDLKLPPLDNTPKKYKNAGLRPTTKLTKSKNLEAIDPFESGGLNDDDINSDRPLFPKSHSRPAIPQKYPENLHRNPARRNDFVEVVESSGQQATIAKAPKAKRAKAPVRINAKALPGPQTAPVLAGNSSSGNTANGAQFLRDSRWRKVFNPTITHVLYISHEPFLNFVSNSSQFLEIVQKLFNISFPDVIFSLTSNDPVVTTAYDRIKTRKSRLADEILQSVKGFFNKPEFRGKPNEIREYIRWALKDGPAYYALPTPRNCRAKRDEPGYIAPDGFLESEFITPVAQKYLAYAANSAMHPPLDGRHPPKGLYAMILLLVERAFSAHLSGQFTVPPHFTHENYWQPLRIFMGKVDNLSERRWARIMTCGPADDDEALNEDVRADRSMISAFRADIYVPASPMKA